MSRLTLSNQGTIIDPRLSQPIQEWVRQRAAEGVREITIDAAQVPSPNSDVLVALSLAARQAGELGLPVVLINANQQLRVAITQFGLTRLGVRIEGAGDWQI